MESIGKVNNSLSANNENFILIGNFNATEFETSVEKFCDIYSFKKLIKEPTCFKNPHNSKCIDLIMTNRSIIFFKNSCVMETEWSDFHKMTINIL